MITRILLLALATSVAGLNAQDNPPAGDKPKREGHGEGRQRRGFPGFDSLTADEQAKVKTVLEAVKDDPAVVAARDAVKAAREAGKTREEMVDLLKASFDATATAAIAKDPSVKELFDKMRANAAKGGEGHGQGGDGKGEGRKGGRKGPPPADAPAPESK